MSKIYDRVHAKIMQDKQRIDNAIAINQAFREKCVKALIETKAYFDDKIKGKR